MRHRYELVNEATQRKNKLTAICDEMVALETGAVIATGTPKETLNHPRVIESYLGTNEAAIMRSGGGSKRRGRRRARS